MISTVAGIAVVVIIAALYFSGSGIIARDKTLLKHHRCIQRSRAYHLQLYPRDSAGTFTPTMSVTDTPPVTVPDEGVIVRVNYIGIFWDNRDERTDTNSKEFRNKVYTLDNHRTITAIFQKQDASTKHDLTVEIYKDGSLLKSAITSRHMALSIFPQPYNRSAKFF